MDPRALLIYTDGSARPKNPGPGGVGFRFVFPDFLEKDEFRKDFILPGYKTATNNQMELKASILGLSEALNLEEIKNGTINSIVICTDSLYLKDNYKKAIYVWPKQKWRGASGAPILNVQLWKDLVKAMQKINPAIVDFEKVKAHKDNEDNNAVDELAKQSGLNPRNKPLYNQIVRRKKSKEKTRRGSVEMKGQRIKIRIISSQYLKEHKQSLLRYEVTSPKNEFYGKVDMLFSEITLRPGHEYLVALGKDMKYPKVEKMIKEIEKSENKLTSCE